MNIQAGQVRSIAIMVEPWFRVIDGMILFDAAGQIIKSKPPNAAYDLGYDTSDSDIATVLSDYLAVDSPIEVYYRTNYAYPEYLFAETPAAYDAAAAASAPNSPTTEIIRANILSELAVRNPPKWMVALNFFYQTALELAPPEQGGEYSAGIVKTSHALFKYSTDTPVQLPVVVWNGTELLGTFHDWQPTPAGGAQGENLWMVSTVTLGASIEPPPLSWRLSRVDDGFTTQFATDHRGAGASYTRTDAATYFRNRFANGTWSPWLPLNGRTGTWLPILTQNQRWTGFTSIDLNTPIDLATISDLRISFIWHAGPNAAVAAAASATITADALTVIDHNTRNIFNSGKSLRATFSHWSGGTLSVEYQQTSGAAGGGQWIGEMNLVRPLASTTPTVAEALVVFGLSPQDQYGTLIIEVK